VGHDLRRRQRHALLIDEHDRDPVAAGADASRARVRVSADLQPESAQLQAQARFLAQHLATPRASGLDAP
jgi:hypothetical protein